MAEKERKNGVMKCFSSKSGELVQRQMSMQAMNLVEALTEELSRRDLAEIPTKDLVTSLARLTLAFVPKMTAVQVGGNAGNIMVDEAQMAEVVAIAENNGENS